MGDYSGRCDVFLGPLKSRGHIEPSLSIHGPAWGLFGSSLAAPPGGGLCVGAPQAGSGADAKDNSGKMYCIGPHVFEEEKGMVEAEAVATKVVEGAGPFMHFGSEIMHYGTTAVVGSEVWHADWGEGDAKFAVGRIQAFDTTVQDSHLSPDWEIVGCDHAGWVGSSFAISEGGKIAIAETGFNHTDMGDKHVVTALNQLRSGRVTVFDLQMLAHNTTYKLCELQAQEGVEVIEPHDAYGRVEKRLRRFPEARFGGSLKWGGGGELWIGAPGKNSGEGAVFKWAGGAEEGGLKMVEGGGGKFARFGAQIGLLGGGGVLVGAPRDSLGRRDSPDEEEYGAVYVVDI